jgi:hypothetical protein
MKLSNETLTVLKNFATINEGIQFKKGTKLSTVSPGKTVLAEAHLKDTFTDEFCVDDLNQFLSVHSLFKTGADLVFDDTNVTFQSGRSKIKYRKTAPSMITIPPEKNLVMPSSDVKFTLTAEDYHWIMDTSKVLSSPNIAVHSDGETIDIITFDASNDAAHTNSLEVGEGDGKKYNIVFKTENIKMIPGTYDVVISFKGIGHFKNTKDDIQYWIAFEAKETKIGE